MAGAAILSSSAPAQAEEPGISATGKGITGGALLGGELVMSIEAIAGAKPAWAYLLGGVAGAAAGGVGGYFVEQGSDPKPSYYLLAGGMALIIPTTVAILQSTSYKPPADYQEDKPGKASSPDLEAPRPAAAPSAPADPGAPPAAPPPAAPTSRATPARPPIAMSLVDLSAGSLRLGLPAPDIRPMYTATEVRKYGVEQRTEVRVPLFQATF